MSKAKELIKLKKMKDSQIDYSNIPAVNDVEGWQRNPYFKPIKKLVSLRMDADVLAWFKKQPKYTYLINTICRAYMDAHPIKKIVKPKPVRQGKLNMAHKGHG